MGDVIISNYTSSGHLEQKYVVDGNEVSCNAQMVIETEGFVRITDSVFNQSGYNAIEIGLSNRSLPKSIYIDNIQFTGTLTNNAISIHRWAPKAEITISNCHFESVSQMLRLSNTANASCTINLINCSIANWSETHPYEGFLICQDFTSKTESEALANNLFSPEKITINVVNCTGPNGIRLITDDLSKVCATGDSNQWIYVYSNAYKNVLSYDADIYPKVNFA